MNNLEKLNNILIDYENRIKKLEEKQEKTIKILKEFKKIIKINEQHD